jgi:ABC-type transport system involved in multi-copper enzyme maturation permease subunit
MAAAFAMLVFFALLTLDRVSHGMFTGFLGQALFSTFSWLSFGFSAMAGVLLTADSISEEKREGTLGLLFLTDLRGYDVVLGKLLATSLLALYGLLAAFPVVGLSFLIGGVTGAAFIRVAVGLLTTLFFSLTAGLLVSAMSRDPQRAMIGALAVLAALIGLPPLADAAVAGTNNAAFEPRLSYASPGFCFAMASDNRWGAFWPAAAVCQTMAWLFLGAACWLAPRSWHERRANQSTRLDTLGTFWRFGTRQGRTRFRTHWLSLNPIRWLAGRDQSLARSLWVLFLFVLGGLGLLCVEPNDPTSASSFFSLATWLASLFLTLAMASQAGRLLGDGVRNGALELLLIAPVNEQDIVRANWTALCSAFRGHAYVLASVMIVAGLLQIEAFKRNIAATPGAVLTDDFLFHLYANVASNVINLFTGLAAIAWFGMWMGMTTRRANLAVVKTFVFVHVLPGLAVGFLQILLQVSSVFAFAGNSWLPVLISGLSGIAFDIAFIVAARRRLSRFRELVQRSVGTGTTVPSPPVLPAVAPLVGKPADR